jgi:Ca-activated chloride channel family protein
MELLDPRGLWILAGIAPLVILYVLRIERPRLRVPSTWLWSVAERDLVARRPWKRLVPQIPLLLQILALAALALALARPAGRGGTMPGDHVAIVVDTSASMSALARRGGAETRLDEAKRAARRVAAALAPGADAFLIEAARDARVVTPPSRDRGALDAAIAGLEVAEVAGNLPGAVALAADRLRPLGGARRIVIVTDGAARAGEPLVAEGIDAQAIVVGEPLDNAAIVRVDVREGTDPATKRDQAQVFAMVESFAAAPREAYVTVSLEGQPEPLASRRVLLEPGAKTPVVLAFEPRREDAFAGLVVHVAPGEGRDGDALASDDTAYATVPPGRAMPVTLASASPRSWLARALEADPDVSLQRLEPAQLATVNVDADALVVVEGACPASLPGADALVVDPPEGRCMGVDVGEAIAQPQLTSWDGSDPRLRFLTLDGVHVARSHPLGREATGGALVRAGGATLIADASIPGRTVTMIGFDVGDSDWPLRASFVLFVRNVVETARVHRAGGAGAAPATGQPLRIAVPAGVTSVRVDGPSLRDLDLPAKDGFAIVPAVRRAGLYRVRWLSPHVGGRLVAVNLTSADESDLRGTAGPVVDGGAPIASAAPAADAHREWSAWVALVAALLLALDVAWLTRARRVSSRARGLRAPLAVAALGAAPLAYVALVHAGLVHDTYLRFGAPVALVVPAALCAWLAIRLGALPPRMGRARRALVTVCALTSILAVSLAVAEPELGRPRDRLTVLVAVDRSRSIDLVPGAEARVRAELAVAERGMRDDDRIGTVVFGAEAATEDPPGPRSDLPPPQRIEVGRDGTDLESAIRRALAEVPDGTSARVALVTDGVQTRGDALAGASAALAADVAVDAVVLEQKSVADVRVASVRAPTRADEGEAIDLRVVTSSAASADVEVRVKRDGDVIHTGRARLAAGEDVLRLREIAGAPGLHRYDVELSAIDPLADASPDDNAGAAFVRVRGPSLALVLEGDPGKGKPLSRALAASGFEVEERSSVGVPADVAGLVGFDLVVLSDVRASDLSRSQIDALAVYTRDVGGGLLLMGGDRSMGPGGYARTPLEDVSPVAFDLKQDERRASLAEVIAIDHSGSMAMTVGGQTKLALANEAAARSATLLGPGDRLGVEHVDTEVHWTVPIAKVSDAPAIATTIRGVSVGGGGIYVDLALRAAYAALEKETVNLKHLLLFADGDDAEQIAGGRAIVRGAATRGITTSVISLGRGHDTMELEALSRAGGGRFYLIEDATRLPAVFTQETILASRSAIHEEPFQPGAGAPGPPTRAIDLASAPPLRGYVVTVRKPRATVLLTAPDGDPLLASWFIGVGRAAAFTSDYKDRWGSAWLAWPGAARMFGQLARDTARRADDPRVRLESDASGGVLHVRADVVDEGGRAQTFRRLSVHVAGPDGIARDVALEAVGAGRYAASMPLSRPGTYVATAKDDVTGEAVGTTGAVLSTGEELRPTGSDRALLARIASVSGGEVRDTLAGVFDRRGPRRFAYAPLRMLLLVVATLAMLLGVAARRLAVPRRLATLAAHTRAHGRRLLAPDADPRALSLPLETSASRLATARRARTPSPPASAPGDAPFVVRASPPASAPTAPAAAPAATPRSDHDPAPPPAPTLSAAERLAKNRRERR